jgi:hypothetical protein
MAPGKNFWERPYEFAHYLQRAAHEKCVLCSKSSVSAPKVKITAKAQKK